MRICGSLAAISGTVDVQGSGYSSSLHGYRQSCANLELLIILCRNGSRQRQDRETPSCLLLGAGAAFRDRNQPHHAALPQFEEVIAPADFPAGIARHPQEGSHQVA